ncbi:MAG: hypothetical protein JWO51_139 [Rhodospirillales bacterium]|nr:hypothetical protein [Rhodospirillales bacterium]
MGPLTGAKGAIAKPQFTDLQVQTSANGLAIPIVYGQTLVAPNLIWYGDFTAIKHASQQGGKGGTPSSSSYTYTAAVMLSLCEGPISGTPTVWANKSAATPYSLGFSLFSGTAPQAVWGYLTSKHPDQALSYPSTAMLVSSNYDLGSSAGLPNHKVEVQGVFYNTGNPAVLPDADPSKMILDYLTNAQYGVGFPSANIDLVSLQTGPASYQAYCMANSLWLSVCLASQEAARTTLARWLQITNSAAFMSGDLLKVVPYGDTVQSGNGYTYTPNVTPIYDLDDDDYVGDGTSDPVQVTRKDPADCKNWVKLEILDRTNAYATDPVEVKDQAQIDLYGALPADQFTAHEICDPNVAKIAAQLILQRSVYIRNTYKFTLGWEYVLLEPMDLVTLTDSVLGLNKAPVRIISIEEDSSGHLTIEAEEFPAGVATATLYPHAVRTAYQVDFEIAPGPVNAPVIFEPTINLTKGNQQIWVAASGGANWGGCSVHLSIDGTTYSRVGEIKVPARLGTTTSAIAIQADPDTVTSLGITIAQSTGLALASGTQADADADRTLIYVGGELMAYETATLTGTSTYTLSYLRRGLYDTAIAAHASGVPFARLDGTQFQYDLPPAYIGVPLFLKFTSFNIYEGAEEDISTVAVYNYTPSGSGTFIGQPQNLTITQGVLSTSLGMQVDLQLNWTAPGTRWVTDYQVSYSLNGGPWTTAKTGGLLSAIIPQVQAGTYAVQVWAVGLGYLSAPANISYTIDTSKIVLPAVTGLELAGQGNNTVFSGADAKFDWRLNSAYGASEALGGSDGANAGYMDIWFQNYAVKVTDSAGNFLRTETVVDPSYTYGFLKNAADAGGPHRSFTVTVTWRDTINQSSLPASLTVTNPPPAVPTNLTVQSGVGVVFVGFTPPTDLDYTGVQVYLSQAEGFTPGPSTLVYDGPNTFVTIPCSTTVNSYIRVAAYDVFGKAGLNFSNELTALANFAVNTVPPASPAGLTLSSALTANPDGTFNNTISAAWTANTEADLTGYDAEIKLTSQGNGSYVAFSTGSNSYAWSSVVPGTSYTVRVRAQNSSSLWSAYCTPVAQVAAANANAPGICTALTATAALRTAFLAWTNPANADLDRVEVWEALVNDLSQAVLVGTTKGSAFTRSGLQPNTAYYYWLRAVNTSAIAGGYNTATNAGATTTTIQAMATDITAGGITTPLLAAGAVTVDKIQAGTITGDRLNINTSLPATITVGATGVSIGTVESQAANPAATVNAGSTLIAPGKILISGAATLASWQNGGDNTKIEGGAIAANTIAANKITIGNRGLTISGLEFSPATAGSNTINWTAGSVAYVNDAGTLTSAAVASGSATYAGSVIYVYWTEGATALATTTTAATAAGDSAVCFATIYGPASVNANYSGTVIDGSKIVTGSIAAAQIAANTITASQIAAGTITTAQIAAGTIVAANIAAGSIAADRIAANAITAAQIAAGTITAAQVSPGSIGDIEQNYLSTQFDLIANSYAAGQWFNWQTSPTLAGNGVRKFLVTATVFFGLGVPSTGGSFMQLRMSNSAGVLVAAANCAATVAGGAGAYGCATLTWVAQPAGNDTYTVDAVWGGNAPGFCIVQNRGIGFTRLAA